MDGEKLRRRPEDVANPNCAWKCTLSRLLYDITPQLQSVTARLWTTDKFLGREAEHPADVAMSRKVGQQQCRAFANPSLLVDLLAAIFASLDTRITRYCTVHTALLIVAASFALSGSKSLHLCEWRFCSKREGQAP